VHISARLRVAVTKKNQEIGGANLATEHLANISKRKKHTTKPPSPRGSGRVLRPTACNVDLFFIKP